MAYRSFAEVSNHVQVMEKIHSTPKGALIRGHIIRVVSVGVRVAHSSGATNLRVGTLHASPISIRVV